jgi:hypothetical protein
MPTLLALLICVTLAASPARPAQSPDQREGGARVRITDSRLAQLLQTGVMRSRTLKALVDRLEAGRVIVYVSLSPLMRANLAGKLTWMTQAGDYRYVRAQISTDLNADQMIATVAHELQHALEVSDDPSVTDQRSLVELYKRIGHQSRVAIVGEWETVAAYEAGLQVRKELVAVPTVLARAAASEQL